MNAIAVRDIRLIAEITAGMPLEVVARARTSHTGHDLRGAVTPTVANVRDVGQSDTKSATEITADVRDGLYMRNIAT